MVRNRKLEGSIPVCSIIRGWGSYETGKLSAPSEYSQALIPFIILLVRI